MSGSFAKRDLQLEASYASLPPCTALTRDLLQRETKTHKKLSVLKKHTRDLLCSNRDQPNRAPRRHRKPTILKKRHKRPAVFKRDLLKRATSRQTRKIYLEAQEACNQNGLQRNLCSSKRRKRPTVLKKDPFKRATNRQTQKRLPRDTRGLRPKRATRIHKKPTLLKKETYCSQKRKLLFSKKFSKRATRIHKKPTVLKKTHKVSIVLRRDPLKRATKRHKEAC